MADWTALAGALGLASALEDIQHRRVREGELQRKLTEGAGEWVPGGGRGGALGFFDALFGYNRPNEMGFGNQRYSFRPYDPVTAEQAKAWGMTYPETTTTPEYLKELPPDVQGPPELIPAQETTRDVPMPGIVGMRLGPKEKMALFQDMLKERFERLKLAEQGKLFDRVDTPGSSSTDTGGATFDLPGTGAPTTSAPPGPPPPAQVPAPQTPGQPSAATRKPFGTPTQAMEDAIADAHRLYPQVRPELIRAIMAKESNFDVRATSPKGAQGLMQLMPATQKSMGVDDPFDIRQNVRGGTRYFAQLLARYNGNEALALAAYNAGPGAVDAAGKQIPNYPETRAFVPGVLALAKPGAFTRATPPPPAQESVPAAGQALPPGAVQVAGPGAGTPSTAADPAATTQQAPGTVQVSPQEAFVLTPEGRQRIESNNRRTLANNQRLQALDQERRRVQAGIRAGMPGMTDRLNALEASVRALRQENTNFYDDSQKTLAEEQKEFRARREKLEERRRRPGEAAAEETAKEEAKQRFRQGQNLYDAVKDDASLFRDTSTGHPVDETQPYRDVQVAQKRKVNGVPQVVRVTKDGQERLEAVESALPRVQRIQQYIDMLYGSNGVYATLGPGQRAEIAKHGWQVLYKEHPEIEAAAKYINANAEGLARAIAGVKGAGSEQDVQRAKDMVATLKASFTLWPLSKFGVSLPDTRAVALRTTNDLVSTLEGTTGQVLRNPNFRYPNLHRYEIAEEPRVSPGRTPAPATTQATGLNPAWVQQRLPAMTPAQIRAAPPEVITDINRVSDIEGLSTEQRKALAERLRRRSAEAVARSRPGRGTGRWALSP